MQKINLIIPCYNEASRLDLDAFRRYFQKDPETGFYFVDDGSIDGTAALLARFAAEHPERVDFIGYKENHGKAEAVRRGVEAVVKRQETGLVGYLDADLSTPLSQVCRFRAVFNRKKRCRLVLGSRFRHMGVRIVRNSVRHYLGRVFSTLASMMVDLPVYDTQCGAKMMTIETARVLFGEPFVSRWLFDIELLFRMVRHFGRRETLKSVVELSLQEWIEKKRSRLHLQDFASVPFELLKIRNFYR